MTISTTQDILFPCAIWMLYSVHDNDVISQAKVIRNMLDLIENN